MSTPKNLDPMSISSFGKSLSVWIKDTSTDSGIYSKFAAEGPKISTGIRSSNSISYVIPCIS